MPKPTQWDSLNLGVSSIQFFFNKEDENDATKCAPLTVQMTVQAQTTEGATMLVTDTVQPFPAQDEAATPQQIYARLVQVNQTLADAFKAVAVQAIDEDPSA